MSGKDTHLPGLSPDAPSERTFLRQSRLIGWLLLGMIIGLISLSVLSIRNYDQLQIATDRWEAHLVERAELFNMYASAANTESNQRNFLVLRDPDLLPIYEQNRAGLLERFDAIEALPDDTQLETTDSLKDIARKYAVELEITDRATELAANGQFDDAIAMVEPAMRRQSPRQVIPAVRQHYELMARQSAEVQQDLKAAQTAFNSMAFILGIIAVLLALLLTWLGRDNILRLRRSERLSQEADAARIQAEEEQQRSEIMMREMNHRVGNSLSMVMSILGMQRSRTKNPDIKNSLKAAQDRVLSVANAQRRLRFSGDMRSVDLKEVLDGVADDLRQTSQRDDILIETDFQPLKMLDRDAVTLALMMNELATNALKHAFPNGRAGTISITAMPDDAGHFILQVEDNGVGLTDSEFQDDNAPSGFGTSIIDRLASQFDGHVDRGLSPTGGYRTTLTLKSLIGTEADTLET